MDPTALLALLDIALRENDTEGRVRAVDDLRWWLANGGFEPRWAAYPDAATHFRAYIGQRVSPSRHPLPNTTARTDSPA